MQPGSRGTYWAFVFCVWLPGGAAATDAGTANAGACKRDGLMNLYAADCSQTVPGQSKMASLVQASPKVPFHASIGGQLQPVRFERAVVLELESKPSYGIQAGNVRFGVRCFRDETNLAFYFPEREMSDYRERSEIVYRVDDSKEKVLELKLAGNSKNILGVWEGYRAVPFLGELLRGGSLHLSALDKRFSEIEAEFDLAELRQRIGTVRRHCNW